MLALVNAAKVEPDSIRAHVNRKLNSRKRVLVPTYVLSEQDRA